ncbi:hypothetical protein [Streptomyces sp. NPDC051219]|uniref:hypothetical protein n=1 Tax=Streptomyces sp. NPDC051219 TaxID=3155283 RepID=UPI003446438B
MALRHAVLAALLDGEYSGYQLAKAFDGDADEEEFLRRGERIGPYLTCLRGLAFEQGHRNWCLRIAAVLRERQTTSAEQ